MSNVLSVDDLILFREIAVGDRRAFRLFFDRYGERIFTFVWQLCHSSVDTEEIV
jgi:DNA-directed RNA polymerase specialized sigma24 family protein